MVEQGGPISWNSVRLLPSWSPWTRWHAFHPIKKVVLSCFSNRRPLDARSTQLGSSSSQQVFSPQESDRTLKQSTDCGLCTPRPPAGGRGHRAGQPVQASVDEPRLPVHQGIHLDLRRAARQVLEAAPAPSGGWPGRVVLRLPGPRQEGGRWRSAMFWLAAVPTPPTVRDTVRLLSEPSTPESSFRGLCFRLPFSPRRRRFATPHHDSRRLSQSDHPESVFFCAYH